jgi:protein TonB
MQPRKTKQADLERKRGTLFLLGLTLSISVILFAFNIRTEIKPHEMSGSFIVNPDDDFYIPPSTKAEQKPDLPAIKTAVNFTLVDNNSEIEEPVEFFSSEITGDEVFDINAVIWSATKEETEEESVTVDWAEIMPEFPGGDKALLNFLSKSVHYPEIAAANHIEGKVYVSFTVDVDGSIKDIRISRSVDTALDNEAKRVVGMMPRWKPGKQAGRNVKVNYTLPVNFVLIN